MGKIFKIALGVLFIGIGAIAVFSAMSADNLFAAINEEDFIFNDISYEADDFTGMDFEFNNRDFIIRSSEDGKIRVTYYTTEYDTVIVDETGDNLELVNDVEWFDQFLHGWVGFVNDDFYDVYLYLPDTVEYELEINTSNGTIDITDIDNITDLVFDTSNGRITIDNVSADSMNLDTSNGEIRLTDIVLTGDLNLSTSNGRIVLDNIVADSIDGKTSNSKVTAEDLVSEYIKLDSSNGDMEVTIIGAKADYEVYMDTSNGDMDYDGLEVAQEHLNEGAPYMLDLHTSNGDITIRFLDN